MEKNINQKSAESKNKAPLANKQGHKQNEPVIHTKHENTIHSEELRYEHADDIYE